MTCAKAELVELHERQSLTGLPLSPGAPPPSALLSSSIAPLPDASITPPPARVGWVDCAKGLGIVLVVFGHVWRGLERPLDIPPGLFGFVDAAVYSFHVPLFFFLSGLFLPRSAAKPAGRFVADKLRTIAYPYFLWYVIQGSASLFFADSTNFAETPASLARRVFAGGYAQFWFLYTLFLTSLLFLALYKMGVGRLAILAVGGLLYLFRPELQSIWLPLGAMASCFLFLSAGAVIGASRCMKRLPHLHARWLVPVGLASFSLILAAAPSQLYKQALLAPLLAVTGIVGTMAIALLLARIRLGTIVESLGRISLPILVAHMLAAAGARIVMQKILHLQNLSAYLVVGTAAGLLLPALLAWACRRLDFEILFTLAPGTASARPPHPAPSPAAA